MAIPVYHMMYSHFSKISLEKLQSLYKDFLWGFTKTGKRKTLMISWNMMACLRSQGRLGIRCILEVDVLLLARWASLIVSDTPSEWVSLFRALRGELLWDHQRHLRRQGYNDTRSLTNSFSAVLNSSGPINT